MFDKALKLLNWLKLNSYYQGNLMNNLKHLLLFIQNYVEIPCWNSLFYPKTQIIIKIILFCVIESKPTLKITCILASNFTILFQNLNFYVPTSFKAIWQNFVRKCPKYRIILELQFLKKQSLIIMRAEIRNMQLKSL